MTKITNQLNEEKKNLELKLENKTNQLKELGETLAEDPSTDSATNVDYTAGIQAILKDQKALEDMMESNEKAAFVIDHDVYFIDIVSDSLLVFEGEGGKHGIAEGPFQLRTGMNRFLGGVDVTFRRDHDSKRPRINKQASRKDREQRAKGDYYSFDS